MRKLFCLFFAGLLAASSLAAQPAPTESPRKTLIFAKRRIQEVLPVATQEVYRQEVELIWGELFPEEELINMTPLLSREDPSLAPLLTPSDMIFIRFFVDGSPKGAGEARLLSVSFVFEGIKNTIWVPGVDGPRYTQEIAIPLRDSLRRTNSNTKVSVQAEFRNEEKTIGNFIFYRPIEGYSLGGNATTVIWFPISIFSTNFGISQFGIKFAPMPISVAFGGKLNFRRNDLFIGGSVITGLVFTNREGESVTEMAAEFFLTRLAIGLLADVGGFLYLGGAAVLDFVERPPDTTGVLVIGLGPKALGFVQ